MRRRRQAIAAVAVGALLLVGAAACGGGSSDGAASSDDGVTTTQAAAPKDAEGGDDSTSGGLPNPCDLVPIERASEILGGESADPVSTDNRAGSSSTSCAWQTQAGKDDPSLDGAGHILTLSVTTPPESMTIDDFWSATKGAGGTSVEVEGCDDAFWLGGLLNALKDDIYLSGSAGLADDSDNAKASTQDLVAAACSTI